VEDKLPQIRKDPGSLLTDGIEVLQGWGASEKVIDPLSIDWSRLSRNYLPYHLRQEPGPSNPLGRVKFMFPNKFGVYLHDTPSRGLFTRSVRTFSSGCIRLENAKQLALRLLEGDADWPAEKILAAMESGQEQTVRLLRPIRVHLLYWTAWADERGTVQFRDDIYGRDRIVEEAIGRRELSPVAGGGGEPGATAN
jgi:murein L,D-transpeptidase YcbB/YkuD